MSFQQGLSGLNAASKSLETIGNNVANANTVGFKSSQAQFADVYASALSGAGAGQIGIGTKLSNVAQQFTQGNITGTNNPLDMAINGGGFFRMSNNGAITYGRNGQFQLDKNGYIVNPEGSRLTGYMADLTGTISKGAPTDINIRTTDLPPVATTDLLQQVNLNSNNTVPVTTPFDPTDPTSYNSTNSVTVYDSIGNGHVMQSYYVKTATAGEWQVYAQVDGVDVTFGAAPGTPFSTVTFGTDGAINAATAALMPFAVNIDLDAVATANGKVNSATATQVVNLDFTGSTQFGSPFGVNKLTQDGYTSGRLSGFNLSADGMITGRYTNGESATLGQIVLANFANPNGLQPLGNNVWAESSASGQALVGTPDSGSLGVLQSSATEDSNVDLTAELVNMITAQRVYQANAQTIKTQDQVMQTLVNLR
ncbi:flagellar hook protein FlgE [Noviherbaspirillum sp. CPCC 100848]|uniref:Flagellar hook protein FlgE n=1 Tax=Noviherbaspirillum album TaxID=3080276 RepID=A0ABU6JCL5_9BURK|nr:flagellar hook protein FlgE [Noviherbaspirillum sp. CPCC 100848]MEC4721372.1 flagellar hook protein FlgE [Noviherbaspirillum sp. CPCC 100848]